MKTKGLCRVLALFSILLTTPASAFVLQGSQWPEGRTTIYPDFVLHGDRTSPSGVSWNQAYKDAANNWNSHTKFQFTIDTASPSHPCAGLHDDYPEDGFRNGAAFHNKICSIDDFGNPDITDFGKKTLAVTVNYTFSSKPQETIESDMFFNDGEPWDVYDGAQQARFDFRRVALHELGHTLGLGHEESKPAIMAPTIGNTYTLQADDIAGAAAMYGEVSTPSDDPIVMSIEEPFDGDVKSGVRTFRGWVVSLKPLTSLTLYLNGTLIGELDHGGPRGDVANKFPQYPDSRQSGFAFATNYGSFPAGVHQYRLVARDNQGNLLEKTVNFTVERFDNAFVKDDALISLDSASVSASGRDVIINGMEHDGKRYNVRLRWKKARQGFEPVAIDPLN